VPSAAAAPGGVGPTKGSSTTAAAWRDEHRLQDGAPGVTDEMWDAAADHFSQEQLSAIIRRSR
jgi:hypothetical protein